LELIDIYHKKSLTEWIIVRGGNQMKWGWVNVGIIPNVGTIPLSKGSGVEVETYLKGTIRRGNSSEWIKSEMLFYPVM
jgi:hypothetical protein